VLAGVAVPEQLVVTVRQGVRTGVGLAVLTVAVGVAVRAGEDDLALRAGRPALDLPAPGLERVAEEEVHVERADVGLVPDLRAGLARAVMDLDCAVVAWGVLGRDARGRRASERKPEGAHCQHGGTDDRAHTVGPHCILQRCDVCAP
jgi:hypothetical protein